MNLRARWTGEPPRVGEYLMSQTRPRWAYRLIGVDRRRGKHVHGSGLDHALYVFECERIPAADVPGGAVVHPWKWDPRRKTGHAWNGATP